MCWICDQKSRVTEDYWGAAAGGSLHFQAAASKLLDGFPADGVGDKLTTTVQDPADVLLVAAITDEIPNDQTTTASITVGGPRVISTINTPGDEDWFRVELEAGVTYEFGQYGTRNGDSGVALPDAWVEIYDSAGNRLAFSDGGSPNDSIGLDALLTFTATESGTYYVNARAFDDVPTNGRTGDFVGDYEVFARVSRYKPYYDLDSPLHSLDWGSQFDGTSRNPDGAEGPRPTGNPVENKLSGKNELLVYFAREGEIFVDNAADPLNLTTTIVAKGLQPWEKAAFNNVFAEYEKVADIDYIETDNRWEADIVVVTYQGTPGPGVSLLGRMSPPDEPSEGQTEYNAGDERWTQEGLAPGGFFFGTLIHEFGHGHGMSHPHDTGGRSSIMRDENTESGFVEETSPFNYTLGTGNLNQGVYTMMSYMDGWQLSPFGQPSSRAGYGYIGSLMALDIAVMQDKYGVNEEWATGNDTYTLMDVNQKAEFDENGNQTKQATAYKSIWDAAGTDSIVYSGARDANIDLRPATLKYEEGGGGWISYAFGIHGGYTIANGVVIENATSGSGNDTLIGNDVANILNGGAGVDTMRGGKASDTYIVDNSADVVIELAGEGGNDAIFSSATYTLATGSEVETLATLNWAGTEAINLTGNEIANYIIGNAGSNQLNGGGGADILVGLGGSDTYIVDHAGDRVIEAVGGGSNDTIFARTSYTLAAGQEVETLATIDWGATTEINLTGNEFRNYMVGNAGANRLDGGLGGDVLVGLGGADIFAFTTALGGANVDMIADFEVGIDKIHLDDSAFAGLAAGALAAGAFRTGNTAQDADDRILYDPTTGALYFDADGNGTGAAVWFATLQTGLSLTANDFAVI